MSFRVHPGGPCRVCATRRHGQSPSETVGAAGAGNPVFPGILGGALFLCLALTWGAGAAEPEEARRSEASGEPAPTESAEKKEKDPPTSRRFVPTEKITADSAISFPVDI